MFENRPRKRKELVSFYYMKAGGSEVGEENQITMKSPQETVHC